jgi:anti-sigma regulatory factor (Ser/Thr protein kinase)
MAPMTLKTLPRRVSVTDAVMPVSLAQWADGQVRVTVPAELGQVRLVRLAAAAYADRLGFDVDDIEDVRVAVDELASCLIEHATSGPLIVVLTNSDDRFAVAGSVPGLKSPVLDELTSQILSAVLNNYETGVTAGYAWFRAEKATPAK